MHAVIITQYFFYYITGRVPTVCTIIQSTSLVSLFIHFPYYRYLHNTYSVHCNECGVVIYLSFTSNNWYVQMKEIKSAACNKVTELLHIRQRTLLDPCPYVCLAVRTAWSAYSKLDAKLLHVLKITQPLLRQLPKAYNFRHAQNKLLAKSQLLPRYKNYA